LVRAAPGGGDEEGVARCPAGAGESGAEGLGGPTPSASAPPSALEEQGAPRRGKRSGGRSASANWEGDVPEGGECFHTDRSRPREGGELRDAMAHDALDDLPAPSDAHGGEWRQGWRVEPLGSTRRRTGRWRSPGRPAVRSNAGWRCVKPGRVEAPGKEQVTGLDAKVFQGWCKAPASSIGQLVQVSSI